jgi:putative transposase
MPIRKRPRSEPTEDWAQLQLRLAWPEQASYELIRPIVLFGFSPAERAKQTGASERTIYRKANRFDGHGMAGLFGAPRASTPRALPASIRRALVELTAEYPAFRPHELARICYARFGRRPSPHTVKRVLAEEPTPARVTRRYRPYAEIDDPTERRLAIVRLHAEGWPIRSVAGYLQVSRPTVYATLRRWIDEGLAGLEEQSRAPKRRARKADLAAINAIRKLQQNPELGEFRIHAALWQLGIRLSPRTCGRILALNRRLYGLQSPSAEPRVPEEMPFRAVRRHQYWTVDLRYVDHQLDDAKVYVISILENYSRAILASGLSRTQDLSAFLMVLYAAIRQHGAPEALVSDSGGIFLATQARAIYRALGITKRQIARRQSWQSYIETAFNIQRRMADWHFSQASTWAELLEAHDRWVADYNYQVHWAHRERQDGRHSPAGVLGWVSGTACSPEELHRAFYTTRFGRRIDRVGYVRFRHWRLYGERGLAGQQAALWLYAATLTLQFADEPLAQYAVTYAPDAAHFHAVTNTRLFETRFRSPQLNLWELRAEDWHLVLRLPESGRRRPVGGAVQAPLFPAKAAGMAAY